MLGNLHIATRHQTARYGVPGTASSHMQHDAQPRPGMALLGQGTRTHLEGQLRARQGGWGRAGWALRGPLKCCRGGPPAVRYAGTMGEATPPFDPRKPTRYPVRNQSHRPGRSHGSRSPGPNPTGQVSGLRPEEEQPSAPVLPRPGHPMRACAARPGRSVNPKD